MTENTTPADPPTPTVIVEDCAHKTNWVWEGPIWTNRVRCTKCGAEWINTRSKDTHD